MRNIHKILMAIPFFSFVQEVNANTKPVVTDTVIIKGNCDMCKKTIERAAFEKGISKAEWNNETKQAVITYNSEKQNLDDVLRKIAYAGYDNQNYLAPADAYSNLPDCCQYPRDVQNPVLETEAERIEINTISQLSILLNKYFELKNELVNSDAKKSVIKANELITLINNIKDDQLSASQKEVWNKTEKELAIRVTKFAASPNIDHQRKLFSDISENMIPIAEANESITPVYLQRCAMYNDGEGAQWLSKDNAIKNPYYGTQMLTCGKTVKIIK